MRVTCHNGLVKRTLALVVLAVVSVGTASCGADGSGREPPYLPMVSIRGEGPQASYKGTLRGYYKEVTYEGSPTRDESRPFAAVRGEDLRIELRTAAAESLTVFAVSESDANRVVQAEVSGSGRNWRVQLPEALPLDSYLKVSAFLEDYPGAIHAWDIALTVP